MLRWLFMMLHWRMILLFSFHTLLKGCTASVPSFLSNADFPCEYPFCADGKNCADARCLGCPFNCFRAEAPAVCHDGLRCEQSCTPESTSKMCQRCIYSNSPVPIDSQCPLGTFRDITASIFSGEDSRYWLDWFRPGKPAQYFSSPTMVDIDGDSVLDFFHPMHGGDLELETGTNARISLGYTVMNKTDSQHPIHLRDAHTRIIVDDPIENGYGTSMDKHGDIVADLDNDGYLDIFFVSGGMRGSMKGPRERIRSRDNFLLFGEEGRDEDTGSNVTIFRGGRAQAKEAGVNGRNGRGRFVYLLDVNQDGLLDMFLAQPRREDNLLAPGNLFINQGNRRWKEDTSMSEFSEAVILTDADGDSIAEEVMMIRGFCFPRRTQQEKRDNPFPDYINDFCSTRPIGSTAIFKFNHTTQQMEEISPNYFNISPRNMKQPECCKQHTHESRDKDCSAVSIASADFDADGRADHVVLYETKLVFFFSSDRPRGELPIEKKYIGLTINLPRMCQGGSSLQLIDMDLSGKLDIVVTCSNIATILIYSQGKKKDKWKLHNNCHDNGSLGDIVFSTFEIKRDDIKSACKMKKKIPKLDKLLCRPYKQGTLMPPRQNGATYADINNDGFTDIILGTRLGYHKFFLYQPSPQSVDNKYISFKLMGNGNDVNLYGIGARLILHTRDRRDQERTHFREISSYQHISDKGGHQDEKITFGLGKRFTPFKVVTTWPNGIKQTLWLSQFNASESYFHPFIEIRYPDIDGYFKIRNEKLSDSGDALCLQGTGDGRDKRKKRVHLENCVGDDSFEKQHFSFDQEGMLRSRSASGYCLAHGGSDDMLHLIKCNSKLVRHNSWHLTQDGYIRLSGSNKVIGCPNVVVKERPYLVELENEEDQRWILDKVKFETSQVLSQSTQM